MLKIEEMNIPGIIDTHAHLYSRKFDSDRDEMIHRAQAAGIQCIVLPNIDLDSIDGMLALEQEYPDLCKSSIGLHPCSVDENYREVLEQMELLFDNHSFIAIGETGLDLYWDKSTLSLQVEALKIQLNWASQLHLPIILHTREANKETLEVVQEHARTHPITGVFHCFSGSIEEAIAIMNLGFYLGIGGTVTFKNSNLREVLKAIGLDRVVLETDSPYLAPVPHRGKRNETAYTALVAQQIAQTMELSVEEVCQITSQNARTLFRL
jgi:TatD DNase family protein